MFNDNKTSPTRHPQNKMLDIWSSSLNGACKFPVHENNNTSMVQTFIRNAWVTARDDSMRKKKKKIHTHRHDIRPSMLGCILSLARAVLDIIEPFRLKHVRKEV